MKNLNNAVLTICLCLLVLCMQPVGDGNGSHTGNPVVSGKLFASDGTPAAGAVVRFIPISQTVMPGTHKTAVAEYTCVTDENGMYGFDSLPDTLYNIFGEGDKDMSFRDSVKVKKRDSTHIPADTLKAPGSMYGIVRLQPEHSSRTVILLLPGTNTFVVPGDSVGHFAITRMARGNYPVRIITTLDVYKPKDTFFTIQCGISDTLHDTIRLAYTGIPVPTGLKMHYDSLTQLLQLSWNRIDTGLAQAYSIYEKNVDRNTLFTMINTSLVSDTSFYVDMFNRSESNFEYRIAAVDVHKDIEGIKCAAQGFRTNQNQPFNLVRTIGDIDSTHTVVWAINSGNHYVFFYYSDPNPDLILKARVFDSTGLFLREFIIRQTDAWQNFNAILDNDRNLYTVFSDTTFKFDSTETLVQKYPIDLTMFDFGTFGTIFISTYDSITMYLRISQNVFVRKLNGTITNTFTVPPATDYIFVTSQGDIYGEPWDTVIAKFDNTGAILQTIGQDRSCGIETIKISKDGYIFTNVSGGPTYIHTKSGKLAARFNAKIESGRMLPDEENSVAIHQNNKIYVFKLRPDLKFP